jgi:hypothetical protein
LRINTIGGIVNGEYELTTCEAGKGGLIGTHKVVSFNFDDTTGGPNVPLHYADVNKTPLTIEVKQEENRFDLVLVDEDE